MADHGFTTTFATARTAAMAAALTATLGLAAASWGIAVWQMHGMDMGVATRLGSFASFIAVWVVMMAAMMLPGTGPAVVRRAQASGGVRAVPLFIGSYLAVWALVGVAVYALYRPHGSVAAGAVTIAAGVYEFTPLSGTSAGAAATASALDSGSGSAAPARASG
jgi:predicted metal-binding membrane protein